MSSVQHGKKIIFGGRLKLRIISGAREMALSEGHTETEKVHVSGQ